LSEFGYTISPRDCTDAKLELLLEDFSEEEKWSIFEQKINRSFISVYKFDGKVIQLDPTVGKSFKKVIEDGLFQYGSSKHFRSDLPQFKTIIDLSCSCKQEKGINRTAKKHYGLESLCYKSPKGNLFIK
jgi:transposase